MGLSERDFADQSVFLNKEARDAATVERAKAEIISRLHLLTQRISRDVVKEWIKNEYLNLP